NGTFIEGEILHCHSRPFHWPGLHFFISLGFMRNRILAYLMLFVSGLLPLTSHAEKLDIKSITLLNVNAAITPATYDYLKQGLRGLPANSLAVIRLNTPGGLVTTTKDIITLIGKGEV